MVHLPSEPVVRRAPESPLAALFDALDDAIGEGVRVLSRLLMDDDSVVIVDDCRRRRRSRRRYSRTQIERDR